jgi:HSP20 family molecular chaperone IbpA
VKITPDNIKSNERHLRKLNNQQKHHILNKEREIALQKELFQKKMENSKKHSELELLNTKERGVLTLNEAVEGRHHRLEKMRADLSMTQERLVNERRNLEKGHQKHIENINQGYSEKIKEVFSEGESKSKDVNDRVNDAIKNTQSDTNRSVSNLRHDSKLKIDQTNHLNKLKLKDASTANQADQVRQKMDHRKKIARAELDHNSKIQHAMTRNHTEIMQREKIHSGQVKAQEEHYKELVNSNKKAYDQKFNSMVKSHKNVVKGLKERFDGEVNKLALSYAEQKEFKATRSEDQFYNMSTLTPTLKESANAYIVSMEIPEHEMDNFSLSAEKRRIKVSLTRRYEDRMDSPDGSVHTSKRSESHRKEFNVAQILDSANITRKYEDGVLSYKIPKA